MSGLEEVVATLDEQSDTDEPKCSRTLSVRPSRRRAASRLDDYGLTIVDVRPLHAYNGWRQDGAPEGVTSPEPSASRARG